MDRFVYINGEFVRDFEARISIFDRGFLFSDSVYEVTTVLEGKLVDWYAHVERLKRSLNSLNIELRHDEKALLQLHRKIIKLNCLNNGLIYMQVSRGSAERDFLIQDNLKASLVMFPQQINLLESSRLNRCLRVLTVPEERWKNRDIKTTQLLAASLAKSAAQTKGFDDAWFVENGYITEGTSSNAFIVLDNNKIITRKVGKEILAGVTRLSISEQARSIGIEVEERPFSVIEAEFANEAFITSSTNFITSVVEINGKLLGGGEIGTITKLLREHYLKNIKQTSI